MGGRNYYLVPAWANLWRKLIQIGADIHLVKVARELLFPVGLFCRLSNRKLIFVGQTNTDINLEFIKKSSHIANYWFYRIGLKWVDYIVAQNRVQKKGFIETFKKRTKIIKNIVTLPISEDTPEKKYILWVGNSSPNKQPEKFLELAKMMPQYRFRMIMSLTPQHPSDFFIKEKLSEIPNMEYLGFVPFTQMGQYYQTASLFVSTSLREGFPNTFLQAWQSAAPVVSLQVNPDEVITQYKLGRESGTFDELAADIKELMENKEERMAMGKSARMYVEEHHAANIVIPQYMDLFNRV